MKTNEVTGRVRQGHAGVAMEPQACGWDPFQDVDILAQAVAKVGVHLSRNPVTFLMVDKKTGKPGTTS
jgi:hypothetical protein